MVDFELSPFVVRIGGLALPQEKLQSEMRLKVNMFLMRKARESI
jgi:hypothetical protein